MNVEWHTRAHISLVKTRMNFFLVAIYIQELIIQVRKVFKSQNFHVKKVTSKNFSITYANTVVGV